MHKGNTMSFESRIILGHAYLIWMKTKSVVRKVHQSQMFHHIRSVVGLWLCSPSPRLPSWDLQRESTRHTSRTGWSWGWRCRAGRPSGAFYAGSAPYRCLRTWPPGSTTPPAGREGHTVSDMGMIRPLGISWFIYIHPCLLFVFHFFFLFLSF